MLVARISSSPSSSNVFGDVRIGATESRTSGHDCRLSGGRHVDDDDVRRWELLRGSRRREVRVRRSLPSAEQLLRRCECFRGRDVVIIGDSIYDVRCGAPHSATTIAIASGKTSAEKLKAENPDHFFESAEDRDAVLKAILL